jgi:hypothetical protein
MADDGRPIDEATIEKLLKLHGAYVEGKIRDSLAAAEAARLEAEQARLATESAPEDAS